jgi:hypothetical protein
MVFELGILSRRLTGAGWAWGGKDIGVQAQCPQQALETI